MLPLLRYDKVSEFILIVMQSHSVFMLFYVIHPYLLGVSKIFYHKNKVNLQYHMIHISCNYLLTLCH